MMRVVNATLIRFFNAAILSGELVGQSGVRRLSVGELFMTSLEPPSSALKEGFLASKIRARIAEHLGADIERINDDSRLSEDFGLDLLDIIELMVVLEEEFAAEREITDEANQIELVVGLIRHIERQSIEPHRETWE